MDYLQNISNPKFKIEETENKPEFKPKENITFTLGSSSDSYPPNIKKQQYKHPTPLHEESLKILPTPKKRN